jgi:type I restriction enzyme M protein
MKNFQDKVNFILTVADDVFCGTFKNHEYGDVILPFVVLRRLVMVLESHKDEVITAYNNIKENERSNELLIQKVFKSEKGSTFFNFFLVTIA